MTSMSELRRFYRCDGEHEQTLFDIWEAGGANGDSVTPSTYSAAYRRWMVTLLRALLEDAAISSLLSVGSGNASVEAEVARAGFPVLCVDALEPAVALARSKGLEALVADVRSWSPEVGRWGIVYADGLLGHLYDPYDGLAAVLKHLREWLAPGPGRLVVSNDSVGSGRDVEAAPGVPVYWLSAGYLTEQAQAAGFSDVRCSTYTYDRPLSGPRERVIMIAHVYPDR